MHAVLLRRADKTPEPIGDGHDRRRIVLVNALGWETGEIGPLLVAIGEAQDEHGRRPLLYLAATKALVCASMRFSLPMEEPPHGFVGAPLGMGQIRICLRAHFGGDPLSRAFYAATRVRAPEDGQDDLLGLVLAAGGADEAIRALSDPEDSEDAVAAFWRLAGDELPRER